MIRSHVRHAVPVLFVLAATLGGCDDGEGTDDYGASRYRVTNAFLGTQQGLYATRTTDDSATLSFASGTPGDPGSEWLLTPLDDGAYRITNQSIGSGLSLDIINDGVFERVTLAPTANVSGQQWQITALDNGYCRLTSAFLGSEIALDVTSDTEAPEPTMRSVNDVSGQHWQLTQSGRSGGELDTRCTGVAPG